MTIISASPSGPPRRITLLAGAHKTASSHLQHSLLDAQDVLRDMGIAVIGPKTIRRDLTPFSQLLRDGVSPEVVRAGANGFLDHHCGAAGQVLLMDENLLGGTDRKMLLRTTRLYPWAPRRVERLLDLLHGHHIDLALAIRNPATFLPSCWSESLRLGGSDDFSAFIQGVDLTKLAWSGFIDRLRDTLPELRLTLWRYEDYCALGPALYAHLLTPEAAQVITHDPKRRRPGLSQKAADWIAAQANVDKGTVQKARKRFPKTTPQDAFVPWTKAEHDAISKNYDQDVARLHARKDITLLQPADTGA